MTAQVPDPCNIPGAKYTFGCKAKDGAKAAKDKVDSAKDKADTAIEFGKDPFGFIAKKEAEAANELTETVIPSLAKLTQPDLTADWFIEAYRISFAVAIFGWVMILIWDLATFRRRGESGQEVVDSFVKWSPAFIGGSMFGPLAGTFLLKGIGYLNETFIRWGISKSAGEIVKEFKGIVDEDPEKFLGGSFVAMLILGALVLSLLLVLLVLLIMMVTLYFTGAVLPLSLMWLTKVNQREKGRKVIMVWLGILCSQPLIFLLLGFAFSGATSKMLDMLKSGDGTSAANASLENLVQMLVVVIMLCIATLGPTTLAAYAPVGPTEGAPGGPGVDARGAGKGGGARGGASSGSPSSSQTSQIAQSNAASGSAGGSAGSSAGAASGSAGTAGAAAGGAATGGTLLAAKAAKDGAEGLADKAQDVNSQEQEKAEGGNDGQAGQAGQGGQGEAGGQGQAGQGGSGQPGLGGSGQDGNSTGGSSDSKGSDEKGTDKKGSNGSDNKTGKGGSKFGSDAGGNAMGAAKAAGRMGQRATGLAQRAGDFAEEQMDHHRDGRRGRR